LIRPYRALATLAVFAAFFVAGNSLGKDERSEPAPVPAKTATVSLGTLRLEPAAGLPELRAVRPERPTRRKTAPAGPVSDVPASGSAEADAAAPPPVDESPPAYTPPPEPQPQSPPANTSPPVQSTPEPPEAPSPDPAPSPAPAPSPDPSPGGGR
jgi:hypothetical protein